jgi:hypothetical protein
VAFVAAAFKAGAFDFDFALAFDFAFAFAFAFAFDLDLAFPRNRQSPNVAGYVAAAFMRAPLNLILNVNLKLTRDPERRC